MILTVSFLQVKRCCIGVRVFVTVNITVIWCKPLKLYVLNKTQADNTTTQVFIFLYFISALYKSGNGHPNAILYLV